MKPITGQETPTGREWVERMEEWEKMRKAERRLNGSALELLEACQHALDQLDDLADPDFIHGMDCPGDESCVVCELRSVISKAKGE